MASAAMISNLVDDELSSSSSDDEEQMLAEQEKEEFEKRKRNIKQQREIQMYLASRSPEELFIEFDADKSGKIEFDEFRMMLKRLNIPMEEAKALKYFRNIDEDGSGAIELPEFKTALYAADPVSGNPLGFAPSGLLTPEDAFLMFDEDKSGQIDEDEFADILEYMGMDVTDAKQEKMFKKFDKDKSGYIDFDEFREVWARVANVREELKKRNIQFSRFTPNWVLRKRLNRIINKEEDDENRAIAQAKHWKIWQDQIRLKKECYRKARILADDTLANALDAGGQVYVFGDGTHGQFGGQAFNHRYEEYGRVQRAWEARVATSEENKRLRRQEKVSIVRIGLEPRITKPPPASSLWTNPFGACNVQKNSAALWSMGAMAISIGLNSAYALLSDGTLRCWGGNSDFYKSVFTDDTTVALREAKMGPRLVTPRSQLLKNTDDMPVPEMENTFDVDLKSIETYKEAKLCEKLKLVFEYYHVYTPPPAKTFIVQHYKLGLLPKITMDDLRFSMKLRCKSDEEVNEGNKLNLAFALAEDLLFEAFKKIDSEALSKLETDIKVAEATGKRGKANKLRRAFQEVWEHLEDEQRHWKSHRKDEEAREKEDIAQESQERYDQKRERRAVQLHNAIDRVLTPRGKGVSLNVGGITTRGRQPSTPRGTTLINAMCCGSHHTAVVLKSGELYTWGTGSFGRLGLSLGDGKKMRESRSAPTLVESLHGKRVVDVSCAYAHSVALMEGGLMVVWGSAVTGKLGLGTVTDEYECFCPVPTPLALPMGKQVIKVSCGHSHTGCVTKGGRVFVWGCGDSGRLGLGRPLITVYRPALVKCLTHEHVADISCGSSHTAVRTRLDYSLKEGVENVHGGRMYVCGAAAILKILTPVFKIVTALKGEFIKRISCGNMMIAAITLKGELWTWGRNNNGAACQPLVQTFIEQPALCRAMYVAPDNVAKGCECRQSSTYNKLGAEIAIDGEFSGNGEPVCTHTQLDIQPYWEVDLGSERMIESVTVWNRQDSPPFRSSDKNQFTKRLFPMWIMCSSVPFPHKANDRRGLSKSLRRCLDKKRFNFNQRRTHWIVPPNCVARYVRIQLEGRNYLHIAQVEVVAASGPSANVGPADDVVCGEDVTMVLIKPRADQAALDSCYKNAVKADSAHAAILRNYPVYYKSYDKFKDCKNVHKCALCRGGRICAVTRLTTAWPLSEEDKLEIADGGPLETRLPLDDIAKLVINQKQPPMEWHARERKVISKTCSIM